MSRVWGKWLDGRGGATAVEFALVAFPFIFMTIGIIELAVMFTTQSLLNDAVFKASRMIRTGQLQQSASSGQEQMFKDAVCDTVSLLIPCNALQYQVEPVPSFGDAQALPPQFDENGVLQNAAFDPGEDNDIVLIRVAYNYPVVTPLMQPVLASNGTHRRMYSTIVMQTEPYQ